MPHRGTDINLPRRSFSMARFALAHIAWQSMMYADMDNASAELC